MGVYYREDRGVWIANFRDSRGQRHRLAAKTRKQAQQLLAEKLMDARKAAPAFENPDITLSEYSAQWLDEVAENLQPKTLRSYEQLLRLHVLPALGHLKVRDVARGHVKSFLSAKRNDGYSKNTLRLLRAVLSALLSDAVDDELRPDNPALNVGGTRRATGKLTKADRAEQIRPFTRDELASFLDSARDEGRYFALFELLAKAGVRPGEAYALRPDDVDFIESTLIVERALGENGQVKSTKTFESRRVDLSRDLVSTLSQHLRWVREEALSMGWGESKWLFQNEAGGHLDQSRVSRVFRRVLKRAALPSHRVYDLRHTYGTLLLSRGAPITYVSHQMGHRDPSTTLRHYTRWLPAEGTRFVDLLNDEEQPSIKRGTKRGTIAQKASNDVLEESREVVGLEASSHWSRREDLNLRPADYESTPTAN